MITEGLLERLFWTSLVYLSFGLLWAVVISFGWVVVQIIATIRLTSEDNS